MLNILQSPYRALGLLVQGLWGLQLLLTSNRINEKREPERHTLNTLVYITHKVGGKLVMLLP